MRHPKAESHLVDSSEVARLLIDQGGADVNAINDNGDTAVSFAISCGLDTVLAYLLTLPGIRLGEPKPGALPPAALAQKLNKLDAATLILSTQVCYI